MPADMFLKLDTIVGESEDREHPGWIEVDSFSWGLANAGSFGGGGSGGGRTTFQDFHFTMVFQKVSPVLFLSCAKGEHIKSAELSVRVPGGNEETFYKVMLEDVLLSSYQSGGSEGLVPTDQFSLNFAKIEFNGRSFDTRTNESA
jgi:type VI secretion system secreted protein Hcp